MGEHAPLQIMPLPDFSQEGGTTNKIVKIRPSLKELCPGRKAANSAASIFGPQKRRGAEAQMEGKKKGGRLRSVFKAPGGDQRPRVGEGQSGVNIGKRKGKSEWEGHTYARKKEATRPGIKGVV